MYEIPYSINNENKTRHFMVHTNYKAQLKAFSKQNLDPFARGTHIEFRYNDRGHLYSYHQDKKNHNRNNL